MSNRVYEAVSGPAQIIRSIIEAEGITQKELAEMIGVSRQRISFILNEGAGMTCYTFEKMIKALGYEICIRKKEL